MPNHFETDVLIVGGGPAGTSTALSILKYSNLKVTIVEQSNLDLIRVGEQVNPSLFELLEYIDIRKSDLAKSDFILGYSNLAAWGSPNMSSRDSIFSNQEENIQLDRAEFDLLLLKKAAKRGASILPRTKCIKFNQLANGIWNVALKHKTKGLFSIKSKYLIDASGRQSFVSRQIGLTYIKQDELVAIGSFVEFDKKETLKHYMLLETVEDGWWYCATLPNKKMIVTLFTDANITKEKQLKKATNLNQLLSKSLHIKHELKNVVSNNKIWARNAFSKVVDITSTKNYIAVGDAIASFDPISSMGIGFAVSSGCNAAKAIIDFDITNNEEHLFKYQQNIHTIYNNHLKVKTQFYNKELRWKESEFWKKRIVSNKLLVQN